MKKSEYCVSLSVFHLGLRHRAYIRYVTLAHIATPKFFYEQAMTNMTLFLFPIRCYALDLGLGHNHRRRLLGLIMSRPTGSAYVEVLRAKLDAGN